MGWHVRMVGFTDARIRVHLVVVACGSLAPLVWFDAMIPHTRLFRVAMFDCILSSSVQGAPRLGTYSWGYMQCTCRLCSLLTLPC